MLLLFYVGALLLRGLCLLIDRHGWLARAVDASVRLLMGPWASLLLALPLAAALATQDGWFGWFGVPTPDQTLYANVPAFAGFGVAFALGWLLQGQPGLLQRTMAYWPLNLSLSLLAIALSLSIVGITSGPEPMAPDYTKLVYALAYSCASWAMVLTMLGLALRFLSGHSPARRCLADACYWIYIIHLPIVMLLQVAASLLVWPWWIEYPLFLGAGLLLMMASYHALVRHSWIGAMLNGRKRVRLGSSQPKGGFDHSVARIVDVG